MDLKVAKDMVGHLATHGAEPVQPTIYSIGHSTHSWERFRSLLSEHRITAVADVRTSPASRAAPWSNRGNLKRNLFDEGISYSFLGAELGGRPSSPWLYTNGVADYEKMARTELFKDGIDRLQAGSLAYRIALMCAERDPLECHRCLLVGRHMKDLGWVVHHILHDGDVEDQEQSETRLLNIQRINVNQGDLLADDRDRLTLAYRKQMQAFAYSEQ